MNNSQISSGRLDLTSSANAGAFAFMVLYLCVSLLRSDWNEVTGLPLLEKVKKKMKKKSRESWQNGSCQLCGLSQFQELYGVSVVSDVLLKDRDVVLAENVLKGVDIAKRLRKKELLSKQFTFYSSPSSDDAFLDEEKDTAIEESQLPVFTLKRPFESRDEIRRLNLFEPRWLRMLDEIAKRNEGSLVGAKLGVVLAQNRLYTPENFNDEDDDNKNIDNQTEKKRVARIVFDPFVQRAKVVDAKESTRPVTGARKVEVFIALDSEANDDFVGEFREAPGQRGYMLASPKKLADERVDGTSSSKTSSEEEKEEEESKIKCVVVCGKLHVRGVVSRLQQGGNMNNSRSGSSSSSSSSSSRDSDSGVVIVTM